MNRKRNAKIVATLGPASNTKETIQALFEAGADVFRLNFSHGSHADHQRNYEIIREIESELGRPIGILMDLQGPKLRLGTFADGPVTLKEGDSFRLDLDLATPGDARRAPLPHREIFAALEVGTDLLIDDGKVRLCVESCGPDFAETRVVAGGAVSNRKGVNVPSVVLPLSALTEKDHADLRFGLELGVDWVALSFVQRAEDVVEIKGIVNGRAGIVAKLEKPTAIDSLERIVEETDAVMVARGDLGVEMPPEQVPAIQKRIVRACRKAGKPVIVATQMLESMISAAVPTRAEASDVATAIYDGADAVMLSAESASGRYPLEAVQMMSKIIAQTEADPHYREALETTRTPSRPDAAGGRLGGLHDLRLLGPAHGARTAAVADHRHDPGSDHGAPSGAGLERLSGALSGGCRRARHERHGLPRGQGQGLRWCRRVHRHRRRDAFRHAGNDQSAASGAAQVVPVARALSGSGAVLHRPLSFPPALTGVF